MRRTSLGLQLGPLLLTAVGIFQSRGSWTLVGRVGEKGVTHLSCSTSAKALCSFCTKFMISPRAGQSQRVGAHGCTLTGVITPPCPPLQKTQLTPFPLSPGFWPHPSLPSSTLGSSLPSPLQNLTHPFSPPSSSREPWPCAFLTLKLLHLVLLLPAVNLLLLQGRIQSFLGQWGGSETGGVGCCS